MGAVPPMVSQEEDQLAKKASGTDRKEPAPGGTPSAALPAQQADSSLAGTQRIGFRKPCTMGYGCSASHADGPAMPAVICRLAKSYLKAGNLNRAAPECAGHCAFSARISRTLRVRK